MKREIRIRAWDGQVMDLDPSAWTESINECLQYQDADVEVMQFTGLVDQTGTPIFEGDIIRHRKYTNQHSDYSFDATPKEVKWNNKYACCEFGTGIFSASPGYLKVVGNIYENPELLEK